MSEELRALRERLTGYDRLGPDDGSTFFGPEPRSLEERQALRLDGRDWPGDAETMIGLKRLQNFEEAVLTVVREGVPGDIIETGVWRGGASMLARAALRAAGDTERRVWLADSFAGLPPPRPDLFPADAGDAHHEQEALRVSLEQVRAGFARHGLLDDQVRFLPGWFKDTLPEAPIERIAVLRLDGDMYESTWIALESLYHRVPPGGFVIVDDYGAVEACRQAVEDFRSLHGITAPLHQIDWTGWYWRVPKPSLDLWFEHASAEARVLMERAEALRDQGDAEGARAAALAALEHEPNAMPAHVLLARLRLPGPDYLHHLRRLHQRLRPDLYVEIGCFEGASLRLARPVGRVLAVDPAPRLAAPPPANATIVQATSDDFFAGPDAAMLAPGIDLAFIDGDHSFAQVLKDFINLERHAAPGGVIVLHDTLPLDEATSTVPRRTTFYSGDGWRLLAVLRELRPELGVDTIATYPTGLTLVRGLDPASSLLGDRYEEIVARFTGLPFQAPSLADCIPGDPDAVDRLFPPPLEADEAESPVLQAFNAWPPTPPGPAYTTPQGLLDWLFFRHYLRAPFSLTDRNCLAWFDWMAEHLAGRPLPAPAGEAPRVSIVMPCLNRAHRMRRAIDSVLAQGFADWELLVVDDGSTDDSAAVAEAYADPRIRLLRHPERRGVGAARNTALAAARGEFIAYLDTDNWWDPRYLGAMLGALANGPEWDVAYGGQYLFRRGEAAPCLLRMSPYNPAAIDNYNYIDINCLVHRRAASEAVGGFREDMRRLEDWEFLLRLVARKAPLFVPVVLSCYSWYAPSAAQVQGDDHEMWHWRPGRPWEPGTHRFTAHPTPDTEALLWNVPLAGAVQAADISIIIPSYEVPEILAQCVDRVFATIDPARVEVILVDNASSAATREVIEALRGRHPALRVEYSERNFGFTHAVNRGLALARPGNAAVLLNNDALVTDGWLEALADVAARQPDVGAVVPRQMLLPQTESVDVHCPMANRGQEADVSLSLHHGNVLAGQMGRPDALVELTFAPFFCVLLTAEALRRLGPLDELRGRHYRSDSLYCEAIRAIAGLRILYTPWSKVYHLLQRSTHALSRQSAQDYRVMFEQNRWEGRQAPIWDR
ncbi:glycosyltransferase [Rhodovarius crocodyli]|uniref:Glycosyltransferase n=1 Tax=Rhodovarius crocodyli TaxID=1979269 RepID=A0A437MM31_9PROT|nr:TylF/MycF/NovP-related O-methyltransferase [Rhodovarius crocodyli]RVT98682.1 glycosyltransferase [Rhodovarius crocodyli]